MTRMVTQQKWAEVQEGDAVIFEHGSTIVSGIVSQVLMENGSPWVVIVEHFGSVDIGFWTLSHIIPKAEREGVVSPP